MSDKIRERELKAKLAEQQVENERLLAANRDCIDHFEALKADYDKLLAEREALKKQEPVATMGTHDDINWHWKEASKLRAGDNLYKEPPVTSELIEAAKAVIERWDSPLWKDLPHTGDYIARLRKAVNQHGKESA